MKLVGKTKKLLSVEESEEFQTYRKKRVELNATRAKAADEATRTAAKVKGTRASRDEVEEDNLIGKASDSALANANQRLEDDERAEKMSRAQQRAAEQSLEKLEKGFARAIVPIYQQVAYNRLEQVLEIAKRKLDHLKQSKAADDELEACASACRVAFRRDDPVRTEAGVAYGAGVPRLASPTIPPGALAELERRISELKEQVTKQGVA